MYSVKKKLNLLFILTILLCLLFVACTPENVEDVEVNTMPTASDTTPDSQIQFTVSFNSMGGSEVDEKKCSYNSVVSRPDTPVKENYQFVGWFVDSLFSREWNFSSDKVTQSMTLFAKWKLKSDIIVTDSSFQYNKSSKKFSTVLSSSTDSISLTGKILLSGENSLYLVYSEKNPNTPIGMTSTADFTNLEYGNNVFSLVVTDSELKPIQTYKIEIYRKKICKVDFYGLDNVYIDSTSVEEGQQISFPVYEPSGFSVTSWKSDKRSISATNKLTVSEDEVFVAQCTVATYSVKLNTNGGKLSVTKFDIQYLSEYTLPIPSQEGKSFRGWFTANGVQLTGGNGRSISAWYYVDVTDIYAQWTTYSFDVTEKVFIDEVQFGESNQYKSQYDDSIFFSIDSAPSIAGKILVFYGWYVNNSLVSNDFSFAIDHVQRDLSVQAIWKSISILNVCEKKNDNLDHFSIQYVNKSRSENDPQKDLIKSGDMIELTVNCLDNKHSFVRWDQTENRNVTFIASSSVQSLTCYWTEYSLSIYYNDVNNWSVSVECESSGNDESYYITWCSDKYTVSYNDVLLDVEYCDCNILGELLQNSGDITGISSSLMTNMDEDTIGLFDGLAELFSHFWNRYVNKSFDDAFINDSINSFLWYCTPLCSYNRDIQLTDRNITVVYCDCDTFIEQSEDLESLEVITQHSCSEISLSVANTFDDIALYFSQIMSNYIFTPENYAYNMSDDGSLFTTYQDTLLSALNSVFSFSDSIHFNASLGAIVGLNNYSLVTFTDEVHNVSTLRTVVANLFGFNVFTDENDDTLDFIDVLQSIVDKYSQNEENASSSSIANRLKYDGAIYTQNGTFVLPYLFDNELSTVNAVYAVVFVLPDDSAYIWINSIADAKKAVNFDNVLSIDEDVNLTIYGRCVLFERDTYFSYSQFHEKAVSVFNNSDLNFLNTIDVELDTAVFVGISDQFIISFGEDITYDSEDIYSVVSRLFGYDDVDRFLSYAGILASELVENSLNAGTSVIHDRIKYSGGIYTSNHIFIFPYAIKARSLSSSTVLCYLIIDTEGNVVLWISDLYAAFTTVNYNNLLSLTVKDTVDVYGRCVLFEKENTKKISYISSGKEVTVTATPDNSTDKVFNGWYNNNNELLSRNLSYTFTMSSNNNAFFAKWIDNPLELCYSIESEVSNNFRIEDYADIRIVYDSLSCGSDFSIVVTPEPGYYFGGLFADLGYTTPLNNYTIPQLPQKIYLLITVTPFEIISNISGAGQISYSIRNISNGISTIKSSGICSQFGKNATFSEGFTYTDVLSIKAEPFNNSVWLGWYGFDSDSQTWILLDTSFSLDIKNDSTFTQYRATWKDVNSVIYARSSEYSIGNVSYYVKNTTNGQQLLQLKAIIGAGEFFEGWYIKKINFDQNDPTSYISEENVCLSYSRELSINLADLYGKYDLSSITARFSEISTEESPIYFYNTDSGLKSMYVNEDGVCKASFIGYYVTSPTNPYYELNVDLTMKQLVYSGGNAVFSNIPVYRNITLTDIYFNGMDIVTELNSSATFTFDANSQRATYLINLSLLDQSKTYQLKVNAITDGTSSNVNFRNVINSDEEKGTIYIADYGNNVILKPVAKMGYAFLNWTQRNYQESNSNPDTTTIYDAVIYQSANTYLTFTANWVRINDQDTTSIYVSPDVPNERGSASYVGSSDSRGNLIIDFYAQTNNGYIFEGWYDEDVLVSVDENFSITCTSLAEYFSGRKAVTYTAKWSEISAKIILDSVAEYSFTGYTVDNITYYNIIPLANIYFDYSVYDSIHETDEWYHTGYYKGYYFLGWYTAEGTLFSKQYLIENISENDLPNNLYAKWLKVPKELFTQAEMDNLIGVDISELNINVLAKGDGEVGFVIYEDYDGLKIKFSAIPSKNRIFYGWYNSEVNDEYLIVTSPEYVVSLSKFIEDFSNNVSFDYNIYASFVSLGTNASISLSMEKKSIPSTFYTTNDDIAQLYYTGHKYKDHDLDKIDYTLYNGVQDGFAFLYWVIRYEDTTLTVYDPVYVLEGMGANVEVSVTGYYTNLSNINLVRNTSPMSGNIQFYGYQSVTPSETDPFVLIKTNYVDIAVKPNSGYVFSKLIAKNNTSNVEIIIQLGCERDLDSSLKCASNYYKDGQYHFIFEFGTDTETFNIGYTFTVYWNSIWQTLDCSIQTEEYINHKKQFVYGYLQKTIYSQSVESYVQRYSFLSDFDDDSYSFMGWNRRVEYELNGDIYSQFVLCENSSGDFSIERPSEDTEFSAVWYKNTVTIITETEDQYPTPKGYTATIEFDIKDYRSTSDYYISEIAFAYLDDLNDKTIAGFINDGYEYTEIDLNKGEGGKYIIMLWKKSLASNPNAKFITEISLSKSRSLTYTAKVIGTDEFANLNYGIDGEPIYCYYSYESEYGKPLSEIGILCGNALNNDFLGYYQFVDYDNKTSLTPYSNEDLYLIFRRNETAVTILQDPVIPQDTTITLGITYPSRYTEEDAIPDGLIFAGWYDNKEYRGEPYDFSKEIYYDMTLYARWYTLSDFNAQTSEVLLRGKNKNLTRNRGNYYFTALSDSQYSIDFIFDNQNASQNFIIYDLIEQKEIKSGLISGVTSYMAEFNVTAGHLYRLSVNPIGSSNEKMTLRLDYDLPADGGKYNNKIPYLSGLEFIAEPAPDQTFLGWFDQNDKELSSVEVFPEDANVESSIFITHNKKYTLKNYEIDNNIVIYAKFDKYSLTIYNPMPEACSSYSYSGDLSVGTKITLNAVANAGFEFVQWLLYDPSTGDTYSIVDDPRFKCNIIIDDVESVPTSKTFQFYMLQTDLYFVMSFRLSDDDTFASNSYEKYDIEYVEAFNNSPQNRDMIFYSTLENGLNTERFNLVDPIRKIGTGSNVGYYVFNGWYYHDSNGNEVSLLNPSTEKYVVDPAIAKNYSVNGKIYIYAKWQDPIPYIDIYTDIDGTEYIYLGEYQQTLISEETNPEEYAEINKLVSNNGYYYNYAGTTKYYYNKSDDNYYRVEKIRWNVIRKNDEKILIQAHSLFDTMYFNISNNYSNDIYANNWEYSSIRSYLNNELITMLFNAYERNLITMEKTSVNNATGQGNPALSDTVKYPWTLQNNTNDYLYFLSFAEATDIVLQFDADPWSESEIRKAEGTDYYKMKVASQEDAEGYYWLRSPSDSESKVYLVDKDGRIVTGNSVSYSYYGFRPVMSIYYDIIQGVIK